MKTIFKLFFSRVPLFSRGNKWATVSPPRCVFLKYALVRSWFHVLKPRMSRNFLGGFYQPGKPLPVFVREEIVDLYNNGVGVSEISCNTRVTKEAVYKVVRHFALHSTTQPFSCGGSEPLEQMIFLKESKFGSYESQVFMLPKSARDRCAKVVVRQRMFAKSSTEWFDYLKRDPYLSISWRRNCNQIHSRTIHMNIGTLRRRASMREARWL